jgi:hypothetical protein
MSWKEMGRTHSTYGDSRGAYNVLEGIPEGRRPLGRLRRRWENYIEINIRDVKREAWIGSIWLRTGTSGGLL